MADNILPGDEPRGSDPRPDHIDPGPFGTAPYYPASEPYEDSGDPFSYDDSSGCREKVCDCLGRSLGYINQTLKEIRDVLSERYRKPCEQVKECVDTIIEEINKKYKGISRTCKQCRQLARDGYSGTLEYALTCSHCTCEECEKECSADDPSTWGKPCKGCGQDVCCCKGGECLPGPCDEAKEVKYAGWCNANTKVVVVTRSDAEPPGPYFQRVAIADTESVAMAEAEAYCSKNNKPYEQPSDTLDLPAIASPAVCSLGAYRGSNPGSTTAKGAQLPTEFAAQLMTTDYMMGKATEGVIANLALSDIIAPVRSLITFPLRVAKDMAGHFANAYGCSSSAWQALFMEQVSLSYVEKMVGLNLQDFKTNFTYAMNAGCRRKYLSPGDAMAAYLANSIEYEDLDTQWAINGFCPESVKWAVTSSRSKPVPAELHLMRRRGIISDSEHWMKMRQLGYLEHGTTEQLYKLTEQLPGLSDIIRFMVRDVDDQAVVNKFGMDTLFAEKYGKQLKTWSEQTGVPEQVALYAWRAHWTIPAPSELFEFVRRLRYNDKFGGKDKLMADVKAALIQQDILPYWHDHYLAVTYRPMTVRDIRRAFGLGVMNEDGLFKAITQLGYDDDTAETLKKFYIALRDESADNHRFVQQWTRLQITRRDAFERMKAIGFPEQVINAALNAAEMRFRTSPFVQAFKSGKISEDTLEGLLAEWGVTSAGIDKIVTIAKSSLVDVESIKDYAAGVIERSTAIAKMQSFGMMPDSAEKAAKSIDRELVRQHALKCQNGVKRRFLQGDIDDQAAINELIKHKTTAGRAGELVEHWKCELSTRSKEATLARLCGWLDQGVIDQGQFRKRLIKLHYSKDDADNIVSDCTNSINAKRAKQSEKIRKDQEAEDRRQEAARRRAAATTQRQLDAAARARAERAKIAQRRDKQLMSFIEKVHGKCECPLANASAFARSLLANLMSGHGFTTDEALQTMLVGFGLYEGGNLDELGQSIETLATSGSGVSDDFAETSTG